MERADSIKATALAQPHRRGDASQLVSYALGRLRRSEQITLDQFNALESYARLASRYMRDVLGSSYHWPRSSISNMSGGIWASMEADPSPETIDRLKSDWADVMSSFADHGLLTTGVSALARVCLMDQDLNQEQIGDARLSANVLHRLWGSRRPRRDIGVRPALEPEAA